MPNAIPELTLRPETDGDADFLTQLYRSTRDDLFQLGLPEPVLANMLDMQFRAQQSGYRSQFPDADYEVVERHGQPVGRLICHRGKSAIRLVFIALLPQERGLGHGRRLIEALQAEAGAAGKALLLSVGLHNSGAWRLYDRLGFQTVRNDGADLEMIWRAAQA